MKKNAAKNVFITAALLDWYSKNARDLPWRRTRDPYAIWVSEIMLQQTQVKTVIPYWERWMRQLPDIESLANAPLDTILKLWEGLGYYTRVRNMQKAARSIVETRGGRFPDKYDEVLALSGIGRYTAGAICSIAFDQPTAILDGNVIRVLTRVFGIADNPRDKKTNERLWSLAGDLVSIAKAQSETVADVAPSAQIPACSFLNQSLMELGALVCTPRQPRCETCPLNKQCVAYRDQRTAELPNLGIRAVATRREFVALIIERNGKFLVRQRCDALLNGNLWEFPNFEVLPGKTLDDTIQPFRLSQGQKPICEIKHSITRYRISLRVFSARLTAGKKAEGQWLGLSALEKLAFPSAHRKILTKLQSAAV